MIISDVVNFPNDCETVRFTACFVSMFMRAEGMTEDNCDFYCENQEGNCIRCGECKDLNSLQRKHIELYNLYTAVTGYGFLQIDLSNDEHMATDWDTACQKILRNFDDYIGFTMDFAGYEFEEIQRPESKEYIFGKMKQSIDQDIPVLMHMTKGYQWILVTGYDENQNLYGFDGSQGYWGKSLAEPSGYEGDAFILPDWHEKMACAFVLGQKKTPTITIQDVFKRGIRIMESMQDKGYYANSVAFMRDENNFKDLSDGQLVHLRDRISQWIGHPIDQRAILGYCMEPLRFDKDIDNEVVIFNAIQGLCWTTHDVLWIAWRAVGQYMGGEKIDWAKGLQNMIIRNAIADCFDIVCRHDQGIFGELKKGFME